MSEVLRANGREEEEPVPERIRVPRQTIKEEALCRLVRHR